MEPAQSGLEDMIDSLQFHDPAFPIIANVSAEQLVTAEDVKSELKLQLQSCVQWNRSIDHMVGAGITEFVEIGPGKVLSGMVKRITRDIKVLNVGDVPTVASYAQAS